MNNEEKRFNSSASNFDSSDDEFPIMRIQNSEAEENQNTKRQQAKPHQEKKMIRCSVCGKLKPAAEFNFLKKKDGKRMNICKECEHDKKKALRDEKKQIMDTLKSVGCACCGEKNTVCLDFHHYDPSEKSFNMSQAMLKPMPALIEEASKCIVVCSNCHRRIHAREINPEDIISRHEYEYRRQLIKTTLSLFGNQKTNKKK